MVSFRSFLKVMDNFFYKKETANVLGLFRVVWMGMIFVSSIIEFGNRHTFYGPQGIISFETALSQFAFPHLNIFQFLKMSPNLVSVVLVLYMIGSFLSCIGLFTRFSLLVTFVLMTSLHQRNIWLLSSSEVLMRVTMIYLIFSPCGESFSLDSFRKNDAKEKTHMIWAQRLMQIQLSFVYFMTVFQKLKGEDWINGDALYYASRLMSFKNQSIPFLFDHDTIITLLTWSTIGIEMGLAVLLWFKEFRLYMLLVGVLFHIMIEYFMSIPFFEWNMILLLLLFIKEEEFINIKNHVLRKFHRA